MITPAVVVGAGLAAASAATWLAFHLGIRLAHSAMVEISDDVAVARAVGVYVPADGGRSSGQMAAAIAHHAQRDFHEHGVPFDLAGCDQCWAEFQELQARAGDR